MNDGNVKNYNYDAKVRLVVKYVNSGLNPSTWEFYKDIQYIKVNKEKSYGFDFVHDPSEATIFFDYYQAETYKRKCMSGDRVGNEGRGKTSIVARAITRKTD